jgi:hypothetical protein
MLGGLRGSSAERGSVTTREWILTAAVIIVPLIIAVVVTLWSLDQVRYRPKKRRPAARVARETSGSGGRDESENLEFCVGPEQATPADGGSSQDGGNGRELGKKP